MSDKTEYVVLERVALAGSTDYLVNAELSYGARQLLISTAIAIANCSVKLKEKEEVTVVTSPQLN